MQLRYWDFSEIDSTEFMDKVIGSIIRNRLSGLSGKAVLRPGRLSGFVPYANSPADNTINFSRDGLDVQTMVTQDGVIIAEDADLTAPVTFGNIGSANPRIDIVAVKHSYSASLPNVAARYITISGDPAANPVPNYANLSSDETPIAEVYIDPTPGIGNPPDISDSHIKMLPSALDQWVADHEPSYGRTDGADGDSGVWARMGRNDDRFYFMRDPDDPEQVLITLNAYHAMGVIRRTSGSDGQCSTVAGPAYNFTSAGSDFVDDGVKPGDQLTITVGVNSGTYDVVDVISSTVLETDPVWPGAVPSINEVFYIESKADSWHQEDITQRSMLIKVTDKVGASDEMFGIYKADAAKQSNTFGSFWDNILSLTADGVLTWPSAYVGQNAVYGCNIWRQAAATIGVYPGWVYNNGKFRVNTTSQTANINNVYDSVTQTWGRLAGEVINTKWWRVYVTTDISGSGYGVALSKTPPDVNDIYLQHPSHPDLRFVGSVYYDHVVGKFRYFIRNPATGFTHWMDDIDGNEYTIPYAAAAGSYVDLDNRDTPWRSSICVHCALHVTIWGDQSGYIMAYDNIDWGNQPPANEYIVYTAADLADGFNQTYSTAFVDLYHKGDSDRYTYIRRTNQTNMGALLAVHGFYEHINHPLPYAGP